METYRVRFSVATQRRPRFEEFLDTLLDEGIFWQTGKVDSTSQLSLNEALRVIDLAASYNLSGEIIPA